MNHPNTQETYVSALYQATAFFITLTVLVILFAIRFNIFTEHDPQITLMKNSETDAKVTVGLHITNFTEFKVSTNEFTFEGTVWFAFNPRTVDLDVIKKFDVAYGQLLSSSDPIIIQHNDETIAQFDVRVQFNTPLNYRLFPLDDHNILIMITNHFLPKNVTLQSSKNDVTFAPHVDIPGWRIVEHNVSTGFVQVNLERGNPLYGMQHQLAIISLSCERSDPGMIINILLTLLLMLFIALFTFSSGEDNVLIVSVSIVALVGYRVVIQSMAPPQVGYFMFTDYIYLLSLTTVLTILLAGTFIREKPRSLALKKGLIVAIYTFFVGGCFLIGILL